MMALTAAFDCIDENGDGVVDFAEWVQVRGRRHRMSLPVRGQRTRTNARTRRGARKTVAGKKK